MRHKSVAHRTLPIGRRASRTAYRRGASAQYSGRKVPVQSNTAQATRQIISQFL
ncbi:hypothetical protein GIV52_07950 [Pseudomonas syringae]|uniref:DUF1534 domain-containing protein n=1 Tax=Pseudomonas syringae TaxID=317 RepID=A0A9Q4A1V1_PSESX|nr:hypothetical protein [Pseudomonas syringae]MCF5474091.1 hypothetical protein [Pseudomonas syringae]MCF5481179.1 hypothetical protein [Pseudomonas syringae]MCF5488317.1 hypothetical protein [Pseudomonas syringae]MCF5493857.1 hypothetical protein [Pseudomonas syringae]